MIAVIFKLNDNFTSIVCDRLVPHDPQYKNSEEEITAILKSLPKNECRYMVCSVDVKYSDRSSEKLAFLSWCPENEVSSKQKMVFAASKEVLRNRCSDMKEFFITSLQDFYFSEMHDKLL